MIGGRRKKNNGNFEDYFHRVSDENNENDFRHGSGTLSHEELNNSIF